jgi:hypothetical protein
MAIRRRVRACRIVPKALFEAERVPAEHHRVKQGRVPNIALTVAHATRSQPPATARLRGPAAFRQEIHPRHHDEELLRRSGVKAQRLRPEPRRQRAWEPRIHVSALFAQTVRWHDRYREPEQAQKQTSHSRFA